MARALPLPPFPCSTATHAHNIRGKPKRAAGSMPRQQETPKQAPPSYQGLEIARTELWHGILPTKNKMPQYFCKGLGRTKLGRRALHLHPLATTTLSS